MSKDEMNLLKYELAKTKRLLKYCYDDQGTADRERLCGISALKSLGLYEDEHNNSPKDVRDAIEELQNRALLGS